MEGKLM